MGKKRNKSYLFDLGDSNDGPVGCCARVTATSKEEALEILKENLPQEVRVNRLTDDGRIDYVMVYLTADNISVADISDGDTENA